MSTRLAIILVGLAATGSVLTAQSSTTINILGQLGSLSFAPNPASVNQGGTLRWSNTDAVVHRIVLDDGSLDTGDIAAGGSSPILTLTTSGGPYHCSIHPSMVGTINLAVPTMSQKVTLLLALFLASLGYLRLRRKNRTSPKDTY